MAVKVLLVGEQVAGQLAWLCSRGFDRLGAATAWVNTSGHPLDRYRTSPWPPLALAAQGLQRAWANARLRQLALEFRPDLVFVTKGEELKPATLAGLKKQLKTVLVNWNPDSPLNPLNATPDLLASIPIYDHYYTWGQFLVGELTRLGARQAGYLPFAYDPELHRPRDVSAEERPQWGNDLVFVGTWEKEREESLGRLLDYDLGIWGNHWARLASQHPLRRRWRGVATGENLSRVYSASRIALNFIRAQNGPAHNMRTFEAPACGIMMLATRTEEQVRLLGEGAGAAFFGTIDELRCQAEYYLAHPEERAQVARTGAERLAQGHTYADRAATVLAAIEQRPSLHPAS